MLLTSGQISMGISSLIIFTFSTLLFLSGYVLQQRTVRDLQEILSNVAPAPPPITANSAALDTFPWHTAGYVRVLHSYSEICDAAMTFAELSRQGSRARRVLVYPRSWDEKEQGRERSLRLLRRVVVRYGIHLRATDEGEVSDRLRDLEKVILLKGEGIVYNAAELDELFLEDGNVRFVGRENDGGHVIAAVVRSGISGLELGETFNMTGLDSRYERWLFGETRALKNMLVDDIGDGHSGLRAAYMRISDPGILGPGYDIPQSLWNQARPESQRERLAWENIYGDYRAQRMDVCGLEVEPLPQTIISEEADL